MPDIDPEQLIEFLGLEPLRVEGGLFRQTHVTEETLPAEALPSRYEAAKPFSTAIFYMLTSVPDSFSALHKLPTDEVYHFYLGDLVEMLELHPDGGSRRLILGPDLMRGQKVQHVARRDVWQGSRLVSGGRFALLGTTMAPGYTDEDYVGGDRDELLERYPQEADLIRLLTRPGQALRMGEEL